MNYREIVWLSSYPKSGNTWVRCFLDAYFLGNMDINELLTTVSDDIAQRCLPGDGTEPHKMPVDVQVLVRGMGLVRMVHQYNKSQIPGVPLIVKTHNAHMLCNGVELLPGALTKSTIHIVRDPRDVILSFAKHMGKSVDEILDEMFFDRVRVLIDKRSPKMMDFISSWPAHVGSYLNADTHNVMVVKYEDMKESPAACFSGILEHAGVKPDMERVKMAIAMTRLERLKDQEKKAGFHESSPFAKDQFFGDGKTGGWRDRLTPAQVLRIEKGCRSLMKRLGYKLTTKAAA